MTGLTTDEKIAVGVGSSVGGVVLIALVALFLWACLSKNRYRPKKRRPDHRYDDAYDNNGFVPNDDPRYHGPPDADRRFRPDGLYPMGDYPYSMPVHKMTSEPTPRELRENFYPRWDGTYKEDPVVVPVTQPEFSNRDNTRLQPSDPVYVQYQDDQAITERANYRRRSMQNSLRRAGSYQDLRDTRPPPGRGPYGRNDAKQTYGGDWDKPLDRPLDRMDRFNEEAFRAGKDPFLWQ